MPSTMSVLRPILVGSAAFALVLLPRAPAMAQDTGTISGRVLDATNAQPLASAQVTVDGTSLGGLTNAEGRFLVLNVPAGERTVRAILIGYGTESQVVTVAPGATAQVQLRLGTTALAMDEIIVTGTGRPTERRRLSADVEVVSTEEIRTSTATNVAELLQGQIPGAQINAVSAQPGSAGLISFRGPSSVMSSQTPVVYIDGVRVDNAMGIGASFGGEQTSALADLAVADIARIEVTKGGAASTLYGADAATGVIQIFTRQGRGEARVTARIEQGVDFPNTKFIQDVGFVYGDERCDGDAACEQELFERFQSAREHPSWDPDFVKNTVLQDGYYQSYYVGASGGEPDLGYSISGRVSDAEGIQFNNGSTMYSLHSGVRARLSDALSADVSGTYLRHNYERLPNGTTTTGVLTNIEVGDFLAFAGEDNLADALHVYRQQDIQEEVDRYTLSTSLTYTPTPLFNARATFGIDKRVSSQRHNEQIDMTATSRHGAISLNTRDFTGLTADLRGTLSYDAPFFSSTSTTVGFQAFRENVATTSMQGEELALPGVLEFDAAALIQASEGQREVFNGGLFLLQQAGIGDQLFLEAGVRFDGNTAFGSKVSYQAYPKVGASFDLASAGLMPDFMNTLRLRANYGATGKFPPPFLRDRTFEAVPFRGQSAPRFDNPGNANLTPERVTTIEAGLDASLWDDRLAFQLTGYRAVTSDALFFVDEQPSTGQTSQLRNVGEILNRGIEVSANVGLIRNASTDWSLSLTYSTLHNEVLDLGGVPPFELTSNGRRAFGWIEEGYPIGVRYMGYPIDTNGDGLLDDSKLGIVRHPETGEFMSPFPTQKGSFATQFDLLNLGLSFSAMADWAMGSTVQDYAAIWSYFNRLPRIEFPTQYDLQGNAIGRYSYLDAQNYMLVDGDFFKLRSLSLRYQLPEVFASRVGSERVGLSVSLRNLWTWVPTPQSIFNPANSQPLLVDPELHGYQEPSNSNLQLGGSQSVALPPPMSLRFGIEVTF